MYSRWWHMIVRYGPGLQLGSWHTNGAFSSSVVSLLVPGLQLMCTAAHVILSGSSFHLLN